MVYSRHRIPVLTRRANSKGSSYGRPTLLTDPHECKQSKGYAQLQR